MKTTKDFKRFISELTLGVFLVSTLNPVPALMAANSSDDIIYPLKEVSKLECRFNEFKDLDSNCKQSLPVLNTKDYIKYATLDGGYNNFTRLYTVLWGASYKYGWDVGNGGHIGTDIATAKGTPVYSMANGKVLEAKLANMEGNMISIEHYIKGKYIVSNYLHLSALNVKKGDIVSVGDKIGEVGSTGNSTGNHLHFQIDLPTPSHPFYYDYKKCPYSYYKITEEGICFDELAQNTIDPLLFLETSGAVLDKITTTTTTVSRNTINTAINGTSEDLSIFDRTVYIDYPISDIKKVQEIFTKIGVYKGAINGDYNDLIEPIIAYQISRGIIKDRNEDGAGWFGPKTRFTTKKDYLAGIKNSTTTSNTTTNNNTTVQVVNNNKIETQKIEKANLMTREEIEKKEVEDFLRLHKIELNFVNQGGNVQVGATETLKLKITDLKGRDFKGEMPGNMTFIVDAAKVSVFPEKLFFFTDGKRDIKLTGIKEGNTNLYVKIGTETIKTISLKVFNKNVTIYPETSKVYSPTKAALGEKQTGIILFQDKIGKNLINLAYGSTYKIKASDDNKICIKEGNIKDIKKIYTTSSCSDEEYKNELEFTYNDTVGGLLIFDYKALSKNLSFTVTNNYDNKVLAKKTIAVTNPTGLNSSYAYTNEIVAMLDEGIVDGINKGYFLQDRGLTQKDSFTWIKNALIKMQGQVLDNETKQKIKNNLSDIENNIKLASKTKTITRQEFLDLNYKYLVFDNINTGKVSYKDIDSNTSIKLAKVFDSNTTWKDQFGENYFRPNETITRGEGVFFLSKTIQKTTQAYLTLK